MSLDQAVRRARDALARDGRGHLEVGARRAIWAELGGRDDGGRRARTTLAISASERVHPIWKALWPDDPLPERLINLARQVLSGAVDTQRASRAADSAQNRLGALMARSPDAAAVAAGYAAHAALFCALYDESFDPNDVDVDALDGDTNPTSATPPSSPRLPAPAARPGIRRRATRSVAASGCGGWAKPCRPRRGPRLDNRRLCPPSRAARARGSSSGVDRSRDVEVAREERKVSIAVGGRNGERVVVATVRWRPGEKVVHRRERDRQEVILNQLDHRPALRPVGQPPVDLHESGDVLAADLVARRFNPIGGLAIIARAVDQRDQAGQDVFSLGPHSKRRAFSSPCALAIQAWRWTRSQACRPNAARTSRHERFGSECGGGRARTWDTKEAGLSSSRVAATCAGAAFARANAAPAAGDAGAGSLAAPPSTPPRAWKPLRSASASATSFLQNNWNRFEENYHPSYVLDENPATAWVEGAAGFGIDESITIPLSAVRVARAIRLRIWNGYQKSMHLWTKNAMPNRVRITVFDSARRPGRLPRA